jgi:outer membrane protein TolC
MPVVSARRWPRLRLPTFLALAASLLAVATPALAQERVIALEEARAAVRANNFQVAIAREQIGQTQTLLDSARAVLLPNVSLSSAFTFNDIEVEFAFPNPLAPIVPYLSEVRDQLNPELIDPAVFGAEGEPSVIQPRTQFTTTLVATQTLFNARAFPLLAQARRSIEIAELGVEATAYQVERAVIETYFAAVGLQRFVEISRQNLELSGLTLESTRAAFEEGVGTQFDVNRAEVERSAAERNLQNAETSYRVAVRSLALLLNEEGTFEVTPPPELEPISDYDPDALDSFRPELLTADLQLELQNERVREQRMLFIPTFSLQGIANIQPTTAFNPRAVRWNISINAQWDIYDAGLRRAERRRREYDMVMTGLQREQTQQQLEAEIDTTMLELDQAVLNVDNARAEVELATTNLELVREAQALGAASSLETILAQQQLFLAELALADAEVRVQQRIYLLQHLALGQ